MKHTQAHRSAADPAAGAPAGGGAGRLVGADRVLAVLKAPARCPGGVGLEEPTEVVGSPGPTAHRTLGALRRTGRAGQDARDRPTHTDQDARDRPTHTDQDAQDRPTHTDQDAQDRPTLGDAFLRMAFAPTPKPSSDADSGRSPHHEARPEHIRVRPVLEAPAHRFGEPAHHAVPDCREAVYRAEADPPDGALRLTPTVGGRDPAHPTAAGELLLARRSGDPAAEGDAWIGGPPPGRRTPRPPCTAAVPQREPAAARVGGHGVDDQETEAGFDCLAPPVFPTSPRAPSGGGPRPVP
ncbi:IclR family transcriptional regulator C-terminal domain-containing protein [Streptomyces sp. DSM 3412]|uniref:IclR family transcriptional regulator C-terminal domain-containing protein n=1 Tax=Streptomyces gottesmaniae TaxID=3075518 RepID=A0ABU2Z8Y6_9ACTN|nr:IclR family transcriptional regulator C-terminal domain-containing protein [Streptomyces sp. DSM 3412]MDT0572583.1 IclR family transcriptional regulator C-terminal domain-containing protein [Streptomyces sp. DSM 3412]